MKKIVVAFILLIIVSCSGSKKLSNRNMAFLYSPGLNLIYPEYRVSNISKDSSRIFFRLVASDLLFMKADSGDFFKSSIGINYSVTNNFESKTAIDTGTFYFNYTQKTDSNYVIIGNFDVHAADSSNYVVGITLTDFNRRQTVETFVQIDRTGIQPAEDFLIVDAETNKPFVSDYTNKDLNIRLLNTNTERKSIYLRYFSGNYPISLPPFAEEISLPLSYNSEKTTLVNLDENPVVTLNKNGIYHFQYDTLIKEGLTIFRFDEDFPKLTDAESLIESIRFLTTRQEYDKIISSSNRKEAVDNFWLMMAGNRERARVLIRNYYSRVQHANIFFSSYLEGWKSDRGLIYIIFGPPSSVYKTNASETWTYSQNYNYGPLNFIFDKIQNPFTKNDFRLRRNIYYEMPWYRAVDSWRDGRVVNDSY